MKKFRSAPFLCALIAMGGVLLSTTIAADRSANDEVEEGIRLFFEAKPKDSVAAFDRAVALRPDVLPQLWQRGLSLYYAEDYAGGRKQFEVHQTVNTQDVENAVWHFLCVARLESVEEARKGLIPISEDTRVPMKQVHELFAGKATPEDVIKAAESATSDEMDKRNHLSYAFLYLGLYEEALGHADQAKAYLLKSAQDYAMPHYMGRVADVHLRVRGWNP